MDVLSRGHADSLVTVRQQYGFNVAGSAREGQGETPHRGPPQRQQQRPAVVFPLGEKVDVGFRGLLNMCNAGSLSSASSLPGNERVEVVGTAHSTAGMRRLVKSVSQGLRAYQEPETAEEGLGGTYFFMNELGRKVAIMKPCDEEPLAPNNPKGFVGRALGEPGLKPTVRVGEAAIREVAAYLLDHDHFSSVPHTVLVRMTHSVFHENVPAAASARPGGNQSSAELAALGQSPVIGSLSERLGTNQFTAGTGPLCKLGSLQEYVGHECDTSEMGASRFAIGDVHRIGILDIRLYNTDRHAGNILVRRPASSASHPNLSALARLGEAQLELVPIDHGFCLPEALEPPYFEWLHWPQAMLPFDAAELAYIAALDARADCELLRRELPSLRVECLRLLEVSTLLLQKCAAAGLSLAEIGSIMSRPLVGLDEEPSALEHMCVAARREVDEACAELEGEEGVYMVGEDDEGGEGVYMVYSSSASDAELEESWGMTHATSLSDSPASTAHHSPPHAVAHAAFARHAFATPGTAPLAPAFGAYGAATYGATPGAEGVQSVRRRLHRDDLLFDLDDEAHSHHSQGHSQLNNVASAFASHALVTPPAKAAAPVSNGYGLVPYSGPAKPATKAAGMAFEVQSPFPKDGAAQGHVPASPVTVLRLGGNGAGTGTCTSSGTASGQSLGGAGSLKSSDTIFGPPGSAMLARSMAPHASIGHPARLRRSGNGHPHRAQGPRGNRLGLLRHHTRVYPPPVEGQSPSTVNAVFTGLSEEEWDDFVQIVGEAIDEGLRAGRWVTSNADARAGQMNMGMSAPAKFSMAHRK